MENFTPLFTIFFLLACFSLAWATFLIVAKVATVIAYSICTKSCKVTFYPQLWVGSLSFTYIMGYIFVL